MTLRSCFFLLCLLFLATGIAVAADYRYISALDLEARLKAGQPTHLVDIQVPEEFAQHHIKGATATYAYPMKDDADKAKLADVLARIKADADPVVIVCPRGAGGATRTYDYLLGQGVAVDRLLILEKGQAGWSCAALTEGQ